VRIVTGNTIREVGKEQPRRRRDGTGAPDAARRGLSGSEGAGRRRAPVMGSRAVLRPYLHDVLDTWCATVVKAHCRGQVVVYRYADDVLIGCELASDARRIMEVLPQRFAKDGLESNAAKTKLVACGRPQRPTSGGKPGTCRLLGCGHSWGKTWRGGYTSKRQTEGKRLRRTLGEGGRWCRDNRHRPLQEQSEVRCAKRRGSSQDYGIRWHSPCLDLVYYTATRAWRSWLHRRGGRQLTWRAFGRMMAAYVLPRPKIVQGWVVCRADSLAHGTSGLRRAGVRAETDDAGCLSRRGALPYGNVRHRGTV
jgi:Reverse transcriptase (RNA-dependent DNA polymerase)